jgi:hypothetical protein
MKHDGIDYLGRFTSFRHVGVFPEQGSHWSHMEGLIRSAGRPVKVLNLFGYTGLASLVAARAGAEVTHVDASKKAIGWARENQELARLTDKPIRWICEDAMKFVEREERGAAAATTSSCSIRPPTGAGRRARSGSFSRPSGDGRSLPRNPDAEAAGSGADGLFDPRLVLRDPRADARYFCRHGWRGRVRRTDHPRKIGRPRAVDLAVFKVGGGMSDNGAPSGR